MKRIKRTEYELFQALRGLFPAAEYALLPQVGNSTGFETTRHADAIALGLWPSRGIHLHGFEIKSNRSDWVRELANPEKAEEIAQYCHHWWIVAAHADIVQPGELPTGWGLLEFQGDTNELRRIKPAPAQQATIPITIGFVAAILRKAQESVGPAAAITDSFNLGYEKGTEDAKRKTTWESTDYERLRKRVADFEKTSGVKITAWGDSGDVGAAVRTVLDGNVKRYADDLKRVAKRILEELP